MFLKELDEPRRQGTRAIELEDLLHGRLAVRVLVLGRVMLLQRDAQISPAALRDCPGPRCDALRPQPLGRVVLSGGVSSITPG